MYSNMYCELLISYVFVVKYNFALLTPDASKSVRLNLKLITNTSLPFCKEPPEATMMFDVTYDI